MKKPLLTALSCAALLSTTAAVLAADVTYERLLKPEPQNWLMHHNDFGSQRFSAVSPPSLLRWLPRLTPSVNRYCSCT